MGGGSTKRAGTPPRLKTSFWGEISATGRCQVTKVEDRRLQAVGVDARSFGKGSQLLKPVLLQPLSYSVSCLVGPVIRWHDELLDCPEITGTCPTLLTDCGVLRYHFGRGEDFLGRMPCLSRWDVLNAASGFWLKTIWRGSRFRAPYVGVVFQMPSPDRAAQSAIPVAAPVPAQAIGQTSLLDEETRPVGNEAATSGEARSGAEAFVRDAVASSAATKGAFRQHVGDGSDGLLFPLVLGGNVSVRLLHARRRLRLWLPFWSRFSWLCGAFDGQTNRGGSGDDLDVHYHRGHVGDLAGGPSGGGGVTTRPTSLASSHTWADGALHDREVVLARLVEEIGGELQGALLVGAVNCRPGGEGPGGWQNRKGRLTVAVVFGRSGSRSLLRRVPGPVWARTCGRALGTLLRKDRWLRSCRGYDGGRLRRPGRVAPDSWRRRSTDRRARRSSFRPGG